MEAFLWFLPTEVHCTSYGHICNVAVLAQHVYVQERERERERERETYFKLSVHVGG
jgi:hypothetical protein